VPQATKATLARAQADREVARRVHHTMMADLLREFSSAPDLSATRHGPVHLGSAAAAGTEQAKAQPASAVGNVTAQTLPDTPAPAEGSTNPADSTSPAPATPGTGPPPGDSSAPAASAAPAEAAPSGQSAAAASTAAIPAAAAPAAKDKAKSADPDPDDSAAPKKKSKLHFLKKIFPF